MSRLERYCCQYFHAACFIVAAVLLATSSSAIGESIERLEARERKSFIQEAMKERREWVEKRVAEMAKEGLAPLLDVAELKPFADWDFYYVMNGTIRWYPDEGQDAQEVEVPEGFVTDLASIPRVFWQVLRPEGRYAYAAVVHDYLYWTQTRPRLEADRILKFAMEDSGVNPRTIDLIYQAVRRFGKSAWDSNAREKRMGGRRFLKRFPDEFTIAWDDWKKRPDVFAEE